VLVLPAPTTGAVWLRSEVGRLLTESNTTAGYFRWLLSITSTSTVALSTSTEMQNRYKSIPATKIPEEPTEILLHGVAIEEN